MDEIQRQTAQRFREVFGIEPNVLAKAPGRVEVLGNHTDYNGGYVLSAAIDRYTFVAAARASGEALTVDALDMGERAQSPLSALKQDEAHQWASYLFGVAREIQQLTPQPQLLGASLAVHSTVPLGAGLSSSAALEVATALALRGLYPFEIEKMALAQLCQRAENRFVGVSSGLMDQFSSVFGRRDHLLFLDCLTFEHEAIPMTAAREPVSLVVCNSMVKHALTGGEYNTRRAECMSAARKLGHKLLRDVSVEALEASASRLSPSELKRARHVVYEDERVLLARDAARAGDMQALGGLMTQSHESSRTNFENSTPELDRLVALAVALPGCYGARLTGGGFGGAILALVSSAGAEEFGKELAARYGAELKRAPDVFVCQVSDGASAVNL